jgi:hypothetical protein
MIGQRDLNDLAAQLSIRDNIRNRTCENPKDNIKKLISAGCAGF